MSSWRNWQGGFAWRRAVGVAVATIGAFFATAGIANAETYFVDSSVGPGGACTAADPCETIAEGLAAHRDADPTGDVIEVEQGLYQENVDATEPADDGLTIRGTLISGGFPGTVISGEGATGAPGCPGCVVGLGTTPDTEVELQNTLVVQETADLDSNLTPVFLDGGSDITTVDVQTRDEATFAAVELCTDPGSEISDSLIDATGTGSPTTTAGVSGCAGIAIRDSEIFTDQGPAITQGMDPPDPLEITRSDLGAAEDFAGSVVEVSSDLILDSSLVTGGETGVSFVGASGADLMVNNATIDANEPGIDDTVDEARSIVIDRSGSGTINSTVDSSILVEELEPMIGSTQTTVTCVYSNVQDFSNPGDVDFTDDCVPTSGPDPNNNTFFDPGDLFEDPPGGDWSLQADAPVIDAGQPGPVPPPFSNTDLNGDPRRLAGTTATCPDGVRDQGAFEAAAVSCGPPPPQQRTLSVSTTGTGTGTVTGTGINCGGGNTDCSETVAPGTQIALTATPADGSSFDGFAGGGCSASPCTVTLDSNKSVQASFTNTRSGQRTLVVETSGTGIGTITGPGIDCGGGETHTDCSQSYPLGERVELRAEAGENSVFDRFTGSGCEADPCTVTMDASRAVVGRFMNARIPRTTFARRPHGKTRNPVFRMRSSQPVSTFECKLDKGEWEECEKRVRLRGLDAGRHVFKARATNKLGVTGPARKAKFRVRRR